MTDATVQTHHRTCNLCEAMCGIVIEHDGKNVLKIKGDKDDPFSHGHICPKATALQDIYTDPDRLRHPVRRTADGWERISWDEAYAEVARNIKAIQAAYGDNAVGVYLGNPNVHNLGSMLVGSTFTRALRTKNRFTATSSDQLPHHVAGRAMFGHFFFLPIPDVDRTDYFLILGANPVASNGSIMTAGGIEPRLKAIQKRGGKVVVIDPRRTETAQKADEHHFIRPGSDALLLLAIVNTIFHEGWVNTGRLTEYIDGIGALREAARPFTPDVVADPTGIDADTIRRLAHEFAHAKTAVCYGRMGLSVQAFGGMCQWLTNAINLITGNLDEPGGAMFTTPAFETRNERSRGKFGRFHSRVSNEPEWFGELPNVVMAEEILTPGDGQIKAMVTVAGNPILSTSNGGQLDQAFESLDFMVAIDIYINETTRHANIILPPTTGLESEHYDVVFHILAVRNSAKYSPALFEPAEDTRHDWQIYRALAEHLATDKRPFKKNDPRNSMTPSQMLDFGLQQGHYGQDGLSLAKLKAHPHGIDLGPLQPQLPEKLFTDNKRIDIAPELFLGDIERLHNTWLTASATPSHQLIGRRHVRSNNSWMHNSKRLVKGKDRCTLMLHPDDADNLGIANGEMVEVESRVGLVRVSAEITPNIMPGVVSLPHGYGHSRKGVKLQVAQEHAGVSINDLTDEKLTDKLTGNAAFSGVPVTIRKM